MHGEGALGDGGLAVVSLAQHLETQEGHLGAGDVELDHLFAPSRVQPVVLCSTKRYKVQDTRFKIFPFKGKSQPRFRQEFKQKRGGVLARKKSIQNNVVHRDLKPENILVDLADELRPKIKIADFGLSTVLTEENSRCSSACGSDYFMAPEVWNGPQKEYQVSSELNG